MNNFGTTIRACCDSVPRLEVNSNGNNHLSPVLTVGTFPLSIQEYLNRMAEESGVEAGLTLDAPFPKDSGELMLND
jgi:hypothetical protein